MSVLDGYIAFLNRASSGLVLPASVGVSTGFLYWLRVGKPGKAALRAIGLLLALLLSWLCMGASIPTWWPDFCVGFGWVGGISLFIVWAKTAKKHDAGCGIVFLLVIAGYLARLILEPLGEPVVFPFLKYGVGYLLFMLAPVALAVVWALIAITLVRASAGGYELKSVSGLRIVQTTKENPAPAWLVISLLYVVAATVFGLMGPFLEGFWGSLVTDALVAIAPCVLAVVVFGTKRNLTTRRLWVVGLYVYVAALLFQVLADSDAPKMHALMSSLLSPQAVAVSCFVLFGAIVVSLFRLIKGGSSPVDGLPLWSVIMPWLSIVPAFYFARLGAWPFLLFVLPNLIVGVVLVVGFALRIGPFGRFPDPRQQEKEEARVAKPAARAARAGRILDLG